MTLPSHKTKIVATIGPASESPEMLERLIRAGLDVARLNFSHGDFAGHARYRHPKATRPAHCCAGLGISEAATSLS